MLLLILFLIGTTIYYIYTDVQFMEKGVNSIPRANIYRSMLTTQWLLVALLVGLWWLLGLRFEDLYFFNGEADISFLIENKAQFSGAIVGAVTVLILMPLVMLKSKNVQAFEKIDFMLPKTIGQRVTFFFVALTAGITEEIIFRGAATYVLLNIGIDMPLWAVGVIASVLFGLAHWYQGVSGILMTGLLGYAMFTFYIQTGSLLIPILLHFLIDVKFVFMPDMKKRAAMQEARQ